jgi:hypothetical protein
MITKEKINNMVTKVAHEYDIVDGDLVYISNEDRVLVEGSLHKIFDSKRLSGEWFDLNEHDIARIAKEYSVEFT